MDNHENEAVTPPIEQDSTVDAQEPGKSYLLFRRTMITTLTLTVAAAILVGGFGYWKLSRKLIKQQQEIAVLLQENASLATRATTSTNTKVINAPCAAVGCPANAIVAVVELREAIRGAVPFIPQMENVEEILHNDANAAPYIASLKPMTHTGIPTINRLQKDFQKTKQKIIYITQELPENPSFSERLKHSFSTVVKIRRTGSSAENTHDSLALLEEAESALAANNIAKAVQIIGNLQEEKARQAASSWLADAETVLTAETAIDALYHYITSPSYLAEEVSKGMPQ